MNYFDNSPLPRTNLNVYEMIYYSAPGSIKITNNGKWELRGKESQAILIDTIAALQFLSENIKIN
jgi:hypothetical protein